MTTSEVAKQAEVNLETIRFYERKGLLPKPPRTPSGYRAFSPHVVGRVRFIKRTQDLGFSLKEIKELLSMSADPGTTCADVRRRAEEKLVDIGQKMRDLERMQEALTRLTAACPGRGATIGCPILGSLVEYDAAPRPSAWENPDGHVMPSP